MRSLPFQRGETRDCPSSPPKDAHMESVEKAEDFPTRPTWTSFPPISFDTMPDRLAYLYEEPLLKKLHTGVWKNLFTLP